MCGIAGFVGFENSLALANQANLIQKHRGPDHQGLWSDQYISLAHQRLSIIDLTERGNQPFEKESFIIVFNGEIYNYKELKERLINTAKIDFKSDSDTEVVLEYYRLYKESCLDFFIGMFSFAIYDRTNQALFIARDHFGIKPLFYFHNKGKFAFASELKTLSSIPDIELSINYRSLISSINYLWISGNGSMFNEISKVPPGHFLKYESNGKLEVTEYWALPKSKVIKSEPEVVQNLKKIIGQSIERHMVADVPVSSFLSGGLDSSLISVLASRKNNNLSTYTIATSNKDKRVESMPDDQKHARELAQLHHFDHNEIQITSKIIDLLPMMVRSLDEPIGDPAAINTFLICQAARKRGVKVLLSGMGADELFAGYRRHKATLLSSKFKVLPLIFQKLIVSIVSILPVRFGKKGIKLVRWAKRFLEFAQLPVEKAYMRSYSYYDKSELGRLLKGNFEAEIEDIYDEHSTIFNSRNQNDVINQMCNTDVKMFMLGLNLTYSDRASMAASVEIRVPFIDKEVVECAMNIPGELKLKSGTSKYILKKMAEEILPKSIVYRPKASFGAPIRSWISDELSEMVSGLLSKHAIEQRGIFNYEFVEKLIDDDRAGIKDNAYQIYQLLTIELWFREFIDKKKIKDQTNSTLVNS